MIKRILALRYVSKKYKLKYKLKLFGDVGWIDVVDKEYCVSLFQKNFYQTLYHEVGHLVADRSLGYKTKYSKVCNPRLTMNGGDVFIRLQEEATASKFAQRFLKVRDKSYLKKCWYGYTGCIASCIDHNELDKFVTLIVKYNKYFEGK